MLPTMSAPLYQPGWYPDPSGRFEFRFHNGSLWTADVSTNGQRYVDPLGASPAPSQPSFSPTAPRSGEQGNGLALASMILGITAASIAWMPFIVAIGAICAFLALLFGLIALGPSRRGRTGRGFAIAGLVTGALAAALCVVGVIFSIAVVDAVDRYDNPAENRASITSCELDGTNAHVVGTIENLDDFSADFTIRIALTRPGTDNPHRVARAFVDDVAPGEAAEFELTRQVGLNDVDCLITGVTGPLPFGLDVEG
jgi:Protein of unknown function (DUF2510)